MRPKNNKTNIVFKAELLLPIQKQSSNPSPKNQRQTKLEMTFTHKPKNNCPSVNNGNTDSTGSTSRSSLRRFKSPQVVHISKLSTKSPYLNSTPSSSSTMHMMSPSRCRICYNSTHVRTKHQHRAYQTHMRYSDNRVHTKTFRLPSVL